MNLQSITSLDQVVPLSKARATLSSLVARLDKEDFFVLVKKYKPEAVLVNLDYFNKLISTYQNWERKKDLEKLEELWESIPEYPEEEIEADIKYALKQIRKRN